MDGIDIYTKSEFDSKIWTGTYSDYTAMTAHDEFTAYAALDGAKLRLFLGDIEFICSCEDNDNGVKPEDIDIDLNGVPIRTDTITVTKGSSVVADWGNNGYPASSKQIMTSYYNFTNAVPVTDAVSIYVGGELPPAIYVPKELEVFQNGVSLHDGKSYFFIVTGRNQLFYINSTPSGGFYRGFSRYGVKRKNSEQIIDTTFNYCTGSASQVTENGLKVSGRYSYASSESSDGSGHAGTTLSIMSSGVETTIPNLYSDGDALVTLIENASEIVLDLTGEYIVEI